MNISETPKFLDIPIGTVLRGTSDIYETSDKTAQGNRAESFAGIRESDKVKVFIKIPRVDFRLPVTQLRKRLQDINMSFENEVYQSTELATVPQIAKVLDKGTFLHVQGHTHHYVPFLVQEFVEGSILSSFAQKELVKSNGEFAGLENAAAWFDLAHKLVTVVKRVHNQGVVHGDIWPDNFLIQGHAANGFGGLTPFLVDFGESFLVHTDFSGESRRHRQPHSYLAPERRQQHRRWYLPADIYSLGGSLVLSGDWARAAGTSETN